MKIKNMILSAMFSSCFFISTSSNAKVIIHDTKLKNSLNFKELEIIKGENKLSQIDIGYSIKKFINSEGQIFSDIKCDKSNINDSLCIKSSRKKSFSVYEELNKDLSTTYFHYWIKKQDEIMQELNFYFITDKLYLYPKSKFYKNTYIACSDVIILQTSYTKTHFNISSFTKKKDTKTIWGIYSNHPTVDNKSFICEKFDKKTNLKISDQNIQMMTTNKGNHTFVLKFVDNK